MPNNNYRYLSKKLHEMNDLFDISLFTQNPIIKLY